MSTYDLICIGAGPTGLACAIEAKRAGMRPLVIDKGCLCNSIYHYPVNMVFFTTPELLEIGDLPLTSAAEKPNRTEALKYYRKCAEHYDLELRLGHRVERVEGADGKFSVHTLDELGVPVQFAARKIAVATGYYDLPNRLGIPGEDLPHVSHYYTEPHPFWRRNVVIIGGKNSAAEAALDLYRSGANVTMVHRRAELGSTIKYWVRPDIENRIKAGQVRALFETEVKRIEAGRVWVSNHSGERALPADQVFALTGYHPDFSSLKSMGITLDPETNKPAMDPTTHESNVPGVYVAGVVIGGNHTSEIFIENGRFHGKQIIAALTGRRLQSATGV
ncbi:MAG TPA: YpdA family putative bacillithiol disulfide reductase [Candidatus Sulfotelmatobacter sp.]|jgi:thioredoxin reductase (NADPH)|nr:YpdA family putative bacillithiol disulfide reductase [Candidatus Sulfotelmatobacter sp.]